MHVTDIAEVRSAHINLQVGACELKSRLRACHGEHKLTMQPDTLIQSLGSS